MLDILTFRDLLSRSFYVFAVFGDCAFFGLFELVWSWLGLFVFGVVGSDCIYGGKLRVVCLSERV